MTYLDYFRAEVSHSSASTSVKGNATVVLLANMHVFCVNSLSWWKPMQTHSTSQRLIMTEPKSPSCSKEGHCVMQKKTPKNVKIITKI